MSAWKRGKRVREYGALEGAAVQALLVLGPLLLTLNEEGVVCVHTIDTGDLFVELADLDPAYFAATAMAHPATYLNKVCGVLFLCLSQHGKYITHEVLHIHSCAYAHIRTPYTRARMHTRMYTDTHTHAHATLTFQSVLNTGASGEPARQIAVVERALQPSGARVCDVATISRELS